MENSLSRVSTNGSKDEQMIDGGPISAIYSASSVGSSKATSPTSATAPRLGPRAPSAHSLLGVGNPADLRRKPHTETDKTNMERASISMPPPASKPKSERRLSASLNAYQAARKSEDAPRSSPTSIRSTDDKRSPISGPSALASTTATDSVHVTTASTGTASAPGLPVLSPPILSAQPPNDLDLVSANSSSQGASSGPAKADASSTLKPEALGDSGTLPTRAPRNNNPRSISSSRRLSTPSQKSVDVPESQSRKLVGTIGVCALDVKARSKPSRQILTRLQADGEFEVIVFGDKAILDEDVANWPVCDFLISFFSDGFPLDKAEKYVSIRKPFVVNDLPMQRVLWDRRLCLRILDKIQVKSPPRLEVNRDGGPRLESAEMANHLRRVSGVVLPGPPSGVGGGLSPPKSIEMPDPDTLVVDGKVIKKPFVEKPVSGEDHSVWIYYPGGEGKEGEGGGRRLFRKIGNKSSAFDSSLVTPRCITDPSGSYLYEQYLTPENSEDIKAYTVGHDYCHAETRKSPVVDGLVRRNAFGKEQRYVTHLTDKERQMASRISRGFAQRICGFDLLRANGESYVIDVNGWSFVKDNENYYNDCAQILKATFYQEKAKRENLVLEDGSSDGLGEPTTGSNRRDAGTTTPGSHSHRQALRGIFKSPSISKLSSHLPSRHHQHGASSPKSSSASTPISSPPTMERSIPSITTGSKISDQDSLLPPPSIPPSALSESAVQEDPQANEGDQKQAPAPMPDSKYSWKLKGVVAVIRHADRSKFDIFLRFEKHPAQTSIATVTVIDEHALHRLTPKEKIKITVHSPIFFPLLKGHNEEVLLKGETALSSLEAAIKSAQREGVEDAEKLRNVRTILAIKKAHPSTKAQIKPMFKKVSTLPASSPDIPEHAEPSLPQSPLSPAPGEESARPAGRKDSTSGTTFSRYAAQENGLVLDKLQIVIKWGGENTHTARLQSQDLANNLRDDFKLLNRRVLDDVRIFSSSEKRVRTTAQIFAAAFVGRSDIPEDFIVTKRDLLDDSNAAKDIMDRVKKRLKVLLRTDSVPEEFTWPAEAPPPHEVLQTVVELMKFHKKVMHYNFKKLGSGAAASLTAISDPTDNKAGNSQRELIDINTIQARWCTNETPELFKARWSKLFSEFEQSRVDPAKISELHDTLKFDCLHNKQFLEWVFSPPPPSSSPPFWEEILALEEATNPPLVESEKEDPLASGTTRRGTNNTLSPNDKHSFAHKIGLRRRSVLTEPPTTPPASTYDQGSYFKLFSGQKQSTSNTQLGRLRELYRDVKILFDYIGPQEYGISNEEKLEIGLLTSLPLLREIVGDLEELQASGDAKSFIYFTKESHIYTLLNCIMEGGIHTKIKRSAIPELDYLSQICFELYEAQDEVSKESKYSIRLSISPGCHTLDPLDVTLDSRHMIQSAPRRSLTDHSDYQAVLSALSSKFNTVSLPRSFLAINISAQHEKDAKGAGEMLQEDDGQVQTDSAVEGAPLTDE